jgi:hypothetical protein
MVLDRHPMSLAPREPSTGSPARVSSASPAGTSVTAGRLSVSRVMVFDWHSPGAAALATALTKEGMPSWATSNPIVAAHLVREHPDIGWAVIECTSSTAPLCRELKAHRPDLEIIGIQADGRIAPRSGCDVGCTLCPASVVETLAPMLRKRRQPPN